MGGFPKGFPLPIYSNLPCATDPFTRILWSIYSENQAPPTYCQSSGSTPLWGHTTVDTSEVGRRSSLDRGDAKLVSIHRVHRKNFRFSERETWAMELRTWTIATVHYEVAYEVPICPTSPFSDWSTQSTGSTLVRGPTSTEFFKLHAQ